MAVRVVAPGDLRGDARPSAANLGHAAPGYVYAVLEVFKRDGVDWLRLQLPVRTTTGNEITGGECWIQAKDVLQAGDAGDPEPTPAPGGCLPKDIEFLAAMKVVREWFNYGFNT